MRLAWLTDIHLDFVESPTQVIDYLCDVSDSQAEAILLGGDISDARTAADYLVQMAEIVDKPIYFVLGNHDFYYGSIAGMRHAMRNLTARFPALRYLTHCDGPVELSPIVGLVGHDGWADVRTGDYQRSEVMLNDYGLIAELSHLTKGAREEVLHMLGDEAANHIRSVLPRAMERYEQTLLLTHVPPFREASWHNGRTSDDEWAPHFTCIAAGEAIVQVAREFPDRQLTVFCGHTHSHGEYRPLANVVVHTGAAQYGEPGIARVMEV